MKRFLAVLIAALILVIGTAWAIVPTVKPQPTLINCYPIVEDFGLRLAITLCLFRLPDPPLKPPVDEREALKDAPGVNL